MREKCRYATGSVATRREVLLRNEKSDFVTRSVALRREEVVKYLKIFPLALPALLAACLSRSLDGLGPSLLAAFSAALLKCF